MGKRIGYLRVSTREQSPDRQILGLQEICDELHIERVSGSTMRRPVFKEILNRLQRGDTLVVWDVDRAFRSVVDAVTQAEKLRARGVEFEIVHLRVDTTTPNGMYVYTIVVASAEWERRILGLRTREGLAAARERGARLGRPPKLTVDDLRHARFRIEEQKEKIKTVATDLNVKPWSLSRALRRANL